MNSKRRSLNSGQALLEYMVIIPGSILLMMLAGATANALRGAYQQTADGLKGQASYCEASTSTTTFAPSSATLATHTVTSSAVTYNSATDRTTVSYTVTSGKKPAISHWNLGISSAVNAQRLSTSETLISYGLDPTTGTTGLKFDRGFNDNETRVITITFRGQFEFGPVNVTTKAGNNQVTTGTVTGPVSIKTAPAGGSGGSSSGC